MFHLAFNVYWLWKFGTLVERVFGDLKCAGIYLLLAFGSSFGEFAVSRGGVGLSGVGYGLCGMLWVLEKRDARFAGAVDGQTSRLFVIWFFACIILTISNVMPVGNVAHGVGAGIGVLLGLAVSGDGALKRKATAGVVAVLILGLAGSTVFWPWVNLSAYAETEVERAGLSVLERGDYKRAVRLLEISARMRHAPARAWYNLGIAYQYAKRYDDAASAYKHAADMPDSDDEMRKTAQDMKSYLTRTKELRLFEEQYAAKSSPVITNKQTNR
jgi:tetratricopeptide (TPR) repeat protein